MHAPVCDGCGGREVRPARWPARLRYWFWNGGDVRSLQVCADCGEVRSGWGWYGVLRSTPSWQRWVRMPWSLLQALRHARHWLPVPPVYAVVGAAAAVVTTGVVVVVRPRPSWVWPPVAAVTAMVAVFVWSLTTAFGQGRARDALGMAVAPRRTMLATARAEAEAEAVVLRDGLAGRALLVAAVGTAAPWIDGVGWRDRLDRPDDPGRAGLDGSGRRGRRDRPRELTSVSVRAGVGPPDTPPEEQVAWVRTVHELEGHPPELPGMLERVLLAELVDHESHDRRPDLAEVADAPAPHRRDRLHALMEEHHRRCRAREEALARSWADVVVLVDGEQVTARRVVGDGIQVARLTHGDAWIGLVAVGVDLDRCPLTTLHDLGPLFEDRRVRHVAPFLPQAS